MRYLLKYIFFILIVKPFLLVVTGFNIRNRERLIMNGPALLVANHNSHLDTLVLMSLFPLRLLRHVRPVAARDYFFRNRMFAFLSRYLIDIIPLERKYSRGDEDPFRECSESLERGDILILFPEGSRGEPERISKFKSGIARLAEKHGKVPVQPVFMHGLGKVLPRGAFLPVPFFCDVFLGVPFFWTGNRVSFMQHLTVEIETLAGSQNFPAWE